MSGLPQLLQLSRTQTIASSLYVVISRRQGKGMPWTGKSACNLGVLLGSITQPLTVTTICSLTLSSTTRSLTFTRTCLLTLTRTRSLSKPPSSLGLPGPQVPLSIPGGRLSSLATGLISNRTAAPVTRQELRGRSFRKGSRPRTPVLYSLILGTFQYRTFWASQIREDRVSQCHKYRTQRFLLLRVGKGGNNTAPLRFGLWCITAPVGHPKLCTIEV